MHAAVTRRTLFSSSASLAAVSRPIPAGARTVSSFGLVQGGGGGGGGYDETFGPGRFQHVVSPPYQGRRRLAEKEAREAGRPLPPRSTPAHMLQQNDYYGRPPSYDAPPPRASAERSFDRAPRESRSYDRDDRRPSSYDRDERRSSPYEDGRMPRERYETRSTRDTDDYRPLDPRTRSTEHYDDRRPFATSQSGYESRAVTRPSDLDRLQSDTDDLDSRFKRMRQRRYGDDAPGLRHADRRLAARSDRESEERPRMKAGYRDVKYNDKCPARRENEHDYDPAGPKEKGSVRGMRKREDKLTEDMLQVKLPEFIPDTPPGTCRFFATFKSGVNYRIAHNAYKQFLRDNGVRSARAVDCDIKDTALFYVKTAKELRLALDRLPAPGVVTSLTPPDADGRPTRGAERLNDFESELWIVKAPADCQSRRQIKKLLQPHYIFRISEQAGIFRLRFKDDTTRHQVFRLLSELPSYEVTVEQPVMGDPIKIVAPPSLEQEEEGEVPTEAEESIVEPVADKLPSDGEPTVPQPSESPEDVLPSGETKGTPPIS